MGKRGYSLVQRTFPDKSDNFFKVKNNEMLLVSRLNKGEFYLCK